MAPVVERPSRSRNGRGTPLVETRGVEALPAPRTALGRPPGGALGKNEQDAGAVTVNWAGSSERTQRAPVRRGSGGTDRGDLRRAPYRLLNGAT